jgi:hypothetical protein
MGLWKEVWIRGPQRCLGYKNDLEWRGSSLKYTQEKGVSMLFKFIYYSRTWGQEKFAGWIAMADLGNFSTPKFVNSWSSDYNRCTNIPFVHQSITLEYHELVKD